MPIEYKIGCLIWRRILSRRQLGRSKFNIFQVKVGDSIALSLQMRKSLCLCPLEVSGNRLNMREGSTMKFSVKSNMVGLKFA